MIGGGRKIYLIVFCVFLFLAAACTGKQTHRADGDFSNEKRLKTLTQGTEESSATAQAPTHGTPSVRAEVPIQGTLGLSVLAQAHLERAKLYTNHRNPRRDYSKGCREFQAYLALVPAEGQQEEDQNWMAVLKELERAENEIADLKGAVKSLRTESDAGRQALESEMKKNKEMRAAMEKTLARLDGLEKANRTLHEANRSMRESNEKMKDIIDQLVQLDQELEQKRRSIK